MPMAMAAVTPNAVIPLCEAISKRFETRKKVVQNMPPPGTRGKKPVIRNTVSGVLKKNANSLAVAAMTTVAAKVELMMPNMVYLKMRSSPPSLRRWSAGNSCAALRKGW